MVLCFKCQVLSLFDSNVLMFFKEDFFFSDDLDVNLFFIMLNSLIVFDYEDVVNLYKFFIKCVKLCIGSWYLLVELFIVDMVEVMEELFVFYQFVFFDVIFEFFLF